VSKTYVEHAEPKLTSGDWDYYPDFAEQFQKIQTKAGTLVPFKLNRSQLYRERVIQEMESFCPNCRRHTLNDDGRPLGVCPDCGTSQRHCGPCNQPLVDGIREDAAPCCPECGSLGLGIPVRICEGKSRRMGASTHYQGRQSWRCMTNRDHGAMIASHEEKSVGEIFRKCKTFHDHMPSGMKPLTKYNNTTMIDFRAPTGPTGLRSWQQVFLAKSADAARGITVRDAHYSEAAFYGQAASAFMLASIQALPELPGTTAAIESTANGQGNYFHGKYLSGRVWWTNPDTGEPEPPPWMPLKRDHPGSPDSEWYSLFVPFFLNDEYRIPLRVSEEEFRNSLDEEERWLLEEFEEFGCTLECLQWRRTTIVDKCEGKLSQFHQEYPATDEQMFATTGSLAFSPSDIERMDEQHACHCEVCLPRGKMSAPEGNDCPPHQWFEIVDDYVRPDNQFGARIYTQYQPRLEEAAPGMGRLSIWEQPEPGHRYIIFADVSKGGGAGDWDHAGVYRLKGMKQVASWRGKVETDEYTDYLVMVGALYNMATIAVEVNGIGEAVAILLKQTRYPRLYRARNARAAYGSSGINIGWFTSESSKAHMVGQMNRGLKELYCVIRGRIEIEEMRIYRKIITSPATDGSPGKAKYSAPVGAHDDAVMTAMGAVAVCGETPGGLPRVHDGPKPVHVFDRYVRRKKKESRWVKKLNRMMGR